MRSETLVLTSPVQLPCVLVSWGAIAPSWVLLGHVSPYLPLIRIDELF